MRIADGGTGPTAAGKRAWSDYMPVRLRHRALELASDEELMDLRRAAVTLEVRRTELLERLDADGALSLFASAREALDAGDLDALRGILDRGAQDGETWREIRATTMEQVRVIEAYDKRVEVKQNHISLVQANMLLDGITRLIVEHVQDKDSRRKIAQGIFALTNRPEIVKELPANVETPSPTGEGAGGEG